MAQDTNIPEFMKPKICKEYGCTNRALSQFDKCLECAVEENLPKLYDDLEKITRAKK